MVYRAIHVRLPGASQLGRCRSCIWLTRYEGLSKFETLHCRQSENYYCTSTNYLMRLAIVITTATTTTPHPAVRFVVSPPTFPRVYFVRANGRNCSLPLRTLIPIENCTLPFSMHVNRHRFQAIMFYALKPINFLCIRHRS